MTMDDDLSTTAFDHKYRLSIPSRRFDSGHRHVGDDGRVQPYKIHPSREKDKGVFIENEDGETEYVAQGELNEADE